MKKIFLTMTLFLILAILSVETFAQDKGNANGFTAKHTTSGNVTIKKGKLSGVINLARQVSGCVNTNREDVKFAPTDLENSLSIKNYLTRFFAKSCD